MDQQTREKLLDRIGQMGKLPDSQRWRKLHDLALELNPELKQESINAQLDNKEIKLTRRSKTGSSESGSWRWGMNIGPGIRAVFEMAEPGMLSATNPDAKRNLRKLMETFPEYRVAMDI